MKINKIILHNYRCFNINTVIDVEKGLNVLIGQNSSGKTVVLEALKKLFSRNPRENIIIKSDFHNPHFGKQFIENQFLYIETIIEFVNSENNSIPEYFEHMIVNSPGSHPYVRIRLEAKWIHDPKYPEGDVEQKYYIIKAPLDIEVEDDHKIDLPKRLRSLIQYFYIPAIRKPNEELKYASGSILFRLLQGINWTDDFLQFYQTETENINNKLSAIDDFKNIHGVLQKIWKNYHKDKRFSEVKISFGINEIESLLKKLEIEFFPTNTGSTFTIDELGEGYRSLFYITLICTLLDIEQSISNKEILPALTILAIEEPENHISPQLLGHVIMALLDVSNKNNSQIFISSHSPSILKRISPESIIHLRIGPENYSYANKIILPDKQSDSFKYVKEAIQNYPEIYFAKLVIIGEGDSESILLNKMAKIYDTNFDKNYIVFAPLGNRFVNHVWKLLNQLKIPHITLLDYDREREGGDWGRIKYVLNQLINLGHQKEKLLKLNDGSILSDKDLSEMHKRKLNLDDEKPWIEYLESYNVFFSFPLDLDFMLLEKFPEEYKNSIESGYGPRIPDDKSSPEYEIKIENSVRATLKSEKARGNSYTDEQKEIMIFYNYLFLGRSKPLTHLLAINTIKDEELINNLPKVLINLFDKIKEKSNY